MTGYYITDWNGSAALDKPWQYNPDKTGNLILKGWNDTIHPKPPVYKFHLGLIDHITAWENQTPLSKFQWDHKFRVFLHFELDYVIREGPYYLTQFDLFDTGKFITVDNIRRMIDFTIKHHKTGQSLPGKICNRYGYTYPSEHLKFMETITEGIVYK